MNTKRQASSRVISLKIFQTLLIEIKHKLPSRSKISPLNPIAKINSFFDNSNEWRKKVIHSWRYLIK